MKRVRFLRAVVAIIAVLSPFSTAAAQETTGATGSISGRVLDEAGRPVIYARVTLVTAGITAGVDVNGRYAFDDVPVGIHQLEATSVGFTGEAVERVLVSSGEATEIDFRLQALEIPVKEIVVTASASLFREEPAAAVALDRNEIRELPHFGDDLFRAVKVLPGTSGSDVSARFVVRGGLYDEMLVTLDGQEVMEPFHLKDFQGVFSILDPEMIGGMELTPSGFTAEHGDRMTAVLAMDSVEPKTVRTEIGISLTTAWVNSAGLFAGGKGGWLASARRGYLDFILKATEDSDDDGDPPDPRYWDAFGKVFYSPNVRNSLSLSVLVADDDLVFEEEDEDEYVDVDSGYTSEYLWMGHQGVVGGASFVNTAGYYGSLTINRDFFAIDEPDEFFDMDDVRDLEFFGLRQGWQHEIGGRHYLRWGFDLRSYDVSYDYELNAEIQDPIDDPRFYPGVRVDSFHDTYEGEQYGFYVTDRMRFSTRFTAEVGVRYDKQTLTSDDQISPRFNLLYSLGSSSGVRFGWGRFAQSQRPYELAVQFGETEFQKAELAEHITAGFETVLGSDIVLRVDAYLRDVSDPHKRWETIFDPFHPVPELATDLALIEPESVSAYGVEAYLASRKGKTFDWWFSYAYSSIEDRLNGVDTPRYVNQPHSVIGGASWRPGPKWTLTGVVNYHTGWPATAVEASLVADPDSGLRLTYDVGPFYQELLDDYFRLDFRAARTSKVGRKGLLTLFIDIQNLTNRENLRGIAIADPEYRGTNLENIVVSFPEEYWLPIIPSFGVSYEF